MRFKVENVGKISHVDIELNGITVLAGNNNTGKSTVGKSLFGLFQAFSNLTEQIITQKSQLSRDTIHADIQGAMEGADDIYYGNLYANSRRITQGLMNREDDGRDIVRKNLRELGLDSESLVDKIIEDYERIESYPDNKLVKRVATNVYHNIFHRKINSLLSNDKTAIIEVIIKDKRISLKFEEDNCSEYEKQLNIMNRAVYIDDPFVIDDLEERFYSVYHIRRNLVKQLSIKMNEVEDVLQQSINEIKVSSALEILDSIGIGDIYTDESGEYRYRDSQIDIPVNNISTGLKSFAIIKTLLEKGMLSHKDILILDEPEIHLHPEWQLKYAQLMVLLQKSLDLTILITTHSHVFLEAVDIYSQKYNINDKCNYYYAESNDTGNYFVQSTDNLEQIYSKMVDPSIELNKLRWEMMESIDE